MTEFSRPRAAAEAREGRAATFGRELDRAQTTAAVSARGADREAASERIAARRERPDASAEGGKSAAPRAARSPREMRSSDAAAAPSNAATAAQPAQDASVDGAATRATPAAAASAPAKPAATTGASERAARAPHAEGSATTRASTVATPHASLPGARPSAAQAPRAAPIASASERAAVPLERARATSAPARASFEDVLEQITPKLRPQLRQALVVLEPADLGRVSIRVRLGEDGLTATLRADDEATAALLERHLPELRAAFEAQGLAVASLDVALDSSDRHTSRDDAPESSDVRGPAAAERRVSQSQTRTPRVLAEDAIDTYA